MNNEGLIEASTETESLQEQLRTYAELLLKATEAKKYQDVNAPDLELGRLHYQMGEIHDELERYVEAEAHYQKAADSFQPSATAQSVSPLGGAQAALSLLKLGELQALSDQAGASSSFQAALAIGQSLADAYIQAYAAYNLGRLNSSEENWQNALIDYQTAERFLESDFLNPDPKLDPTLDLALNDSPKVESQKMEALRADILMMMAIARDEIIIQQAFQLTQNPAQVKVRSSRNEPSRRPRWFWRRSTRR